jgi:hypothetical protein
MRVLEIQEENRRNPPPVTAQPVTDPAVQPQATLHKDISNTKTVSSGGMVEDQAYQNPSQVELSAPAEDGDKTTKPVETQ